MAECERGEDDGALGGECGPAGGVKIVKTHDDLKRELWKSWKFRFWYILTWLPYYAIPHFWYLVTRRPNAFDWAVYKLFRWWWNPILRRKPNLAYGLAHELSKWVVEKSPPGSYKLARGLLSENAPTAKTNKRYRRKNGFGG